VTKLLLAIEGVNLNAKNSYGGTPLSWAAGNGHEEVFKFLLAIKDINLNTKNSDGRTPLSLAAGNGHETIVNLLLAMKGVETELEDLRGENVTVMGDEPWAYKGYQDAGREFVRLLEKSRLERLCTDKDSSKEAHHCV
jgi:ankyrin repeat protein